MPETRDSLLLTSSRNVLSSGGTGVQDGLPFPASVSTNLILPDEMGVVLALTMEDRASFQKDVGPVSSRSLIMVTCLTKFLGLLIPSFLCIEIITRDKANITNKFFFF